MRIYFTVTRTSWDPAPTFFVSEEDKRKFYEFLAGKFITYVRRAMRMSGAQILLARFRPSLDPTLRHKVIVGYKSYYRELESKLLFWSESNEVRIGYVEGTKMKSGKDLTLFARELEYGSTTVPPRPVFREAQKHMERNLEYYYQEFRRRV